MTNTYMQKVIDKVDVSEVLDKHTGEMLNKPESVEIGTIAPEIFTGISTLDISKDISDKLTASVPLDGIEIKPTGQIYLCHIQYRRMLNDAFGMGNWALRPLGGFQRTIKTKRKGEQNEEDTIIVCREYALYVRGKYASSAIGEQEYIESNDLMSASDACEGTESNAIMRCCKKLGMGLEMWDKKFVNKFIKEYCVQVWRKGKSKPQYRLKDGEPWFDETGVVDPNKKQVPAQPEPQIQRTEAKHEQPYNGQPVVGIKSVTSKDGNTNGKAWIKYFITTSEGETLPTFDRKIAVLAEKAQAEDFGVIITKETKGKYTNIIGMERMPEPDFSDPKVPADDINHEEIPF